MNITQTSNKELAKGISVAPSLISLLRFGKRKQLIRCIWMKFLILKRGYDGIHKTKTRIMLEDLIQELQG